MANGESRRLTTSEAAELCDVRPDTVLKWIKNGRLQAVRTAGGHHRIAYRNLEPFLGALGAKQEVQPGSEGAPRPVRCGEFFSNQGVVRERLQGVSRLPRSSGLVL